MAKKKNLYVMDTETGKYAPLEKVADIHAEQLTLDLDELAPTIDEMEGDFEAAIDLSREQMRDLLDDGWIVDIDDTYGELVDTLGKIHDEFLNGIYYVTKAKSLEEAKTADKTMKDIVRDLAEKADMLTEVYYKSCYNEYLSERDDAFAAFTPEKLN